MHRIYLFDTLSAVTQDQVCGEAVRWRAGGRAHHGPGGGGGLHGRLQWRVLSARAPLARERAPQSLPDRTAAGDTIIKSILTLPLPNPTPTLTQPYTIFNPTLTQP